MAAPSTGERTTPPASPDRSEPARARVLTVDDHRPFLALLRDLVGASDWLLAVGEADSGERAVTSARELEPDLVVMDVRMPGIGGVAAARQIKAGRPRTVVTLISATHPDDLALDPSTAAADEIVWKRELSSRLLDQIWQRHRPGPPPSSQ